MKILKKFLVVLLSIVALLLIIALFVPKTYTVSVSETINKPKSEVYDYIKFVKNQENYSDWVLQDSISKPTYIGTDGTVGFVSAWNSTITGVGEQEITKLIINESIAADLRFKEPFESDAKTITTVKETAPGVTVISSEFFGNDSYPMNLLSFVGKSMIQEAEQKSLANLKKILEKK